MWKRSNDTRPEPPSGWAPCSEAELADAWQARLYAGPWLVDCCGRRQRVVFPGRRWGGPGPDFRGAALALADGTLIHGDVELHRRASSWAGHHHAQDPAYAGVVLHVVRQADAETRDGLGRHVPTVVLEPALPADSLLRLPSHEPGPCVRMAPAVLGLVAEAGRQRFQARVARFEGDLAAAEPDQVVWRGVAEALGFAANARPFAALAEAVPWPEAARVAVERGSVGLAGLLLGTAGLLGAANLPEAHHWRALQRQQGARPALRAATWDRRQQRAANAPAGRCRGLAELAVRWAGRARAAPRPSLAEQVLEAVHAAAGAARPSLWQLGYAPPWVGRGRAQVIAINVLLPFAAAAGLGPAAEALFERLPGEPSNRVLRYMAAQLGGSGVRFRGACQQQGLLHLFKQTCASRRCEHCPARGTVALIELPP